MDYKCNKRFNKRFFTVYIKSLLYFWVNLEGKHELTNQL